MDAMTTDEFAELSYADRLAYALAKVPNLPHDSLSDPSALEDPSSLPGFYWQQVEVAAIGNADTTVGAKIISIEEYYVTDPTTKEASSYYQESVDSILASGGAGVGDSTAFDYDASGEIQSGVDRNGNAIDFRDITYHKIDQESGQTTQALRTAQVLRVPVKLLDGSTVVFYPQAYVIDGKESPDDVYPY